jgi:hypothetical protein
MDDQDPVTNREVAQRDYILKLTKSIWNGCEESAIISLKYIYTLFDTVFQRRQTYFAMKLVLVGDLIPCICMHWRRKFSSAYCYWAIKVLNKVIIEYASTRERLINNGTFTSVIMKYGTLGAHENKKVAMELMELFYILLLVDDEPTLSCQEVCKCIDAIFIMLRERPNYVLLHTRAYQSLTWTCHHFTYYESTIHPNVHTCLVMRKLNHYLKAETARLIERADSLICSKQKRSFKRKLRGFLFKPLHQIHFQVIKSVQLSIIMAERKDSLAILTLAIWKSKIDAMYDEEPNRKRRRTRSHFRTIRQIALSKCQSDVILSNVLTFLPHPLNVTQ